MTAQTDVKERQPKILFILADGVATDPVQEAAHPLTWNEFYASVPVLAEFKGNVDGVVLQNRKREGSTPDRWQKTAKIIEANYRDYDGFVITDNIESAAIEHASALSYMLNVTDKPVILTHAQMQRQVHSVAEESVMSLVRAGYWAGWTGQDGERVRGVCLFHQDRLVQGNRACILHDEGQPRLSFIDLGLQDACDTWGWQYDAHMSVQPGLIAVSESSIFRPAPDFNTQLSTADLIRLDCTPPSLYSCFPQTRMLDTPDNPACLAVVGSKFQLPPRLGGEPLLSRLADHAAQGGLVCVVNQMNPYDPTGLLNKDNAEMLLSLGICPLINLTPQTAWAKMAFVMGQKDWSLQDKKGFMITPSARDGTVDPRRIVAPRACGVHVGS